MPIYEYSCKKCGKVVDLLQKMDTKNAGIVCPACGEDALTKVLSVTAPAQVVKKTTTRCDAANNQGLCGGCCHGCQ